MIDFFKIPKRTHIILLAVMLFFTLVYVRIRTNVYHLSYSINSSLNLERELTEKNRKLKIEAASLRAPARIGRLAADKLNLRSDINGKNILVHGHDTTNK